MRVRTHTLGLLAVMAVACTAAVATAGAKFDEAGEVRATLSERSGLTSVLDEARSGGTGVAASFGMGFERLPMRPATGGFAAPRLRDAQRPSSDRLDPGAAVELAAPAVFAFAPVMPNPFERGTMLRFDLPTASRVSIETYDVRGRAVKGTLSEDLGPGRYQRRWDGVDDAGRSLPPGIYLIRIHASTAEDGRPVQAVRKLLMFR